MTLSVLWGFYKRFYCLYVEYEEYVICEVNYNGYFYCRIPPEVLLYGAERRATC